VNKAKLSKWDWIKNVGVLVAATAGVLSAIPRAFAETNSTTTSQIIWSIDPAPIVNLILAILPVVIVLMVVQAIFKSLTSYTRLARIKQVFASPKAKALGLGLLSLLGLLVCGVTLAPVYGQETSSGVNFDVSGLVNIVLALMPLIIILVVMKALIGAMKDLAVSTPLKVFLAILGVVALTFGLAFAPAYGQTTGSLDLSQVTSGIVQIVFAILPIILVLVVVKTLLDAFARMT
jgi:hypothetical protein